TICSSYSNAVPPRSAPTANRCPDAGVVWTEERSDEGRRRLAERRGRSCSSTRRVVCRVRAGRWATVGRRVLLQTAEAEFASGGEPPAAREGREEMTGIQHQAESWTSQMRAEQSALDLGAELGPADPTA